MPSIDLVEDVQRRKEIGCNTGEPQAPINSKK